MNRATRQRRRGSSKVKYSLIGNRLDRVLCYGSMGNVSYFLAAALSLRLMDIIFCSGSREERLLVRQPFQYAGTRTHGVGQFDNH